MRLYAIPFFALIINHFAFVFLVCRQLQLDRTMSDTLRAAADAFFTAPPPPTPLELDAPLAGGVTASLGVPEPVVKHAAPPTNAELVRRGVDTLVRSRPVVGHSMPKPKPAPAVPVTAPEAPAKTGLEGVVSTTDMAGFSQASLVALSMLNAATACAAEVQKVDKYAYTISLSQSSRVWALPPADDSKEKDVGFTLRIAVTMHNRMETPSAAANAAYEALGKEMSAADETDDIAEAFAPPAGSVSQPLNSNSSAPAPAPVPVPADDGSFDI